MLNHTMNPRAKDLLEQAKLLSDDERAELGHELLASIETEHEEPIEDVEKAWAAELTRRLEDVDSGRAKTVPADEAIARVRARLQALR